MNNQGDDGGLASHALVSASRDVVLNLPVFENILALGQEIAVVWHSREEGKMPEIDSAKFLSRISQFYDKKSKNPDWHIGLFYETIAFQFNVLGFPECLVFVSTVNNDLEMFQNHLSSIGSFLKGVISEIVVKDVDLLGSAKNRMSEVVTVIKSLRDSFVSLCKVMTRCSRDFDIHCKEVSKLLVITSAFSRASLSEDEKKSVDDDGQDSSFFYGGSHFFKMIFLGMSVSNVNRLFLLMGKVSSRVKVKKKIKHKKKSDHSVDMMDDGVKCLMQRVSGGVAGSIEVMVLSFLMKKNKLLSHEIASAFDVALEEFRKSPIVSAQVGVFPGLMEYMQHQEAIRSMDDIEDVFAQPQESRCLLEEGSSGGSGEKEKKKKKKKKKKKSSGKDADVGGADVDGSPALVEHPVGPVCIADVVCGGSLESQPMHKQTLCTTSKEESLSKGPSLFAPIDIRQDENNILLGKFENLPVEVRVLLNGLINKTATVPREAYVHGGFIRDRINDEPPNDIDIVCFLDSKLVLESLEQMATSEESMLPIYNSRQSRHIKGLVCASLLVKDHDCRHYKVDILCVGDVPSYETASYCTVNRLRLYADGKYFGRQTDLNHIQSKNIVFLNNMASSMLCRLKVATLIMQRGYHFSGELDLGKPYRLSDQESAYIRTMCQKVRPFCINGPDIQGALARLLPPNVMGVLMLEMFKAQKAAPSEPLIGAPSC